MTMQEQLAQYYERVGIKPVARSSYDKMFEEFCCPHKCACRKACLDAFCRAGNKKEDFLFQPHTNDPPTATTIVSPYYQDRKYHDDCIPRIVVLSLSIPQPEPLQDQVESQAEQKKKKKKRTPLKPHWRETLAMVRSLLHPFKIFLKPARYLEDTGEIEQLFVHVRTAKCCSNANGRGQEPAKVYENCGKYLGEELSILKPDVIVTQGDNAHRMAEQHAFNAIEQVKGLDIEYPIAHIANLKEDDRSVYWLRSYFPTYWGYYTWHAGKKIDSEINVVGAKRKNLVRYGEEIKEFMKSK